MDQKSPVRRLFAALPRPGTGVPGLTLVSAAFITVFLNTAFWKAVMAAADIGMARNVGFGLALLAAMIAFFVLLISLFGVRYVIKPAIVLLLLIASAASYFMNVYGVVIDDTMIHNILETDPQEASGLVNPRLLLHMLITGVLPSIVVCVWRVRYRSLLRETAIRAVTIVAAIAVLGVSVFVHYKDFSLVLRQNRELRYLVNPTYPIYAVVDAFTAKAKAANTPVTALGEDARQHKNAGALRKVVVLVVGETARAANFSLDGYERMTNPLLSKRALVNFTDFSSCGTSTSVSVPCMFSHLGRKQYDEYEARHTEGLLDVLSHAGVGVLWRENNSGCKGVCERVPTDDLSKASVGDLCNEEECFDEILLAGLKQKIDASTGDLFIVLHQKGSHGPEYYKRYPERFEVFQPVCASNSPQDCKQQTIVNAYDNTILYTDYFLDRVIGMLQKVASGDTTATAMFYLSDHGESLGENGLYLHGFPYALAPKYQTHIPALAWFSPDFGLDQTCLSARSHNAYSQDNIFDTVLGLFSVQTAAYTQDLNIFSGCEVSGSR